MAASLAALRCLGVAPELVEEVEIGHWDIVVVVEVGRVEQRALPQAVATGALVQQLAAGDAQVAELVSATTVLSPGCGPLETLED